MFFSSLSFYAALIFLINSGEHCYSTNSQTSDTENVIGIDFGTSYSCVGVYKNGVIRVIPNEHGSRITPSYIASTEYGELLVGDFAKCQQADNPHNTIFQTKRFLGHFYSDPEIGALNYFLPFTIVGNRSDTIAIEAMIKKKMKSFRPEDLAAMILFKMKKIAEDYLRENVTKAVLTVPNYFNQAQRFAIRDAAKLAGLNISSIISSPIAIALAYGLEKRREYGRNIVIIDLGGGSLDVSVIESYDGRFINVTSIAGYSNLGGEDFDNRVLNYILRLHYQNTGQHISSNKIAMQKLRKEIERAKRFLSDYDSTTIEIESLVNGQEFSKRLTRSKFEQLNADLFEKIFIPIKKALNDANLKSENIDEVFLAGGSIRIPKIRQMIEDYFPDSKILMSINPNEVAAIGAAIQGGIISGAIGNSYSFNISDKCPYNLGIEAKIGRLSVIIPNNTLLPTIKSMVFVTAEDNQVNFTIKIYEGEGENLENHLFLGSFKVSNIKKAPRGETKVDVMFILSKDQVLTVIGQELPKGSLNYITIDLDQRSVFRKMTKEEIQERIKENEDKETLENKDKDKDEDKMKDL